MKRKLVYILLIFLIGIFGNICFKYELFFKYDRIIIYVNGVKIENARIVKPFANNHEFVVNFNFFDNVYNRTTENRFYINKKEKLVFTRNYVTKLKIKNSIAVMLRKRSRIFKNEKFLLGDHLFTNEYNIVKWGEDELEIIYLAEGYAVTKGFKKGEGYKNIKILFR